MKSRILRKTRWVAAIIAFFMFFQPTLAYATTGDGEGAGENPCETSILPDEWCNAEDGEGIYSILNLIIGILTAGVGVGATVGIVISAVQWLTARDSEEQIKKARTRLIQIVIGLLVYALMWAFLQWIIPGGIINSSTRSNEASVSQAEA